MCVRNSATRLRRLLMVFLLCAAIGLPQSSEVSKLKPGRRIQLATSSTSTCIVRLTERTADYLEVTAVRNSALCGPEGRRFRIPLSGIEAVSKYRERPSRAEGLKMMGAVTGLIFASMALGFGARKGIAAWGVLGGGLAALTLTAGRNEIRHTVHVSTIPSMPSPGLGRATREAEASQEGGSMPVACHQSESSAPSCTE